MSRLYSFLKDELALAEIRKHKWIESEKEGQEIGFATAALDWIKRFGQAWINFRLSLQQNTDPLLEKRQYRRFDYRFPIQLKIAHSQIACHTDNVNLIGLSCTIPAYIPDNTPTEVTIRIPSGNTQTPQMRFHFVSRITRVHAIPENRRDIPCRIFVPFTEEVRDFIRNNAAAFQN